MLDRRHPLGWLFYLLLAVVMSPAQPGRMKMAEDRIVLLEKSEIRRGVYDRILNAAITVAISAAIAMRDR